MLLVLSIIAQFLLTHMWSTNLSIKVNAANFLLLQSDRGFSKPISFPCFLLRNLFFYASIFPLLDVASSS